MKFDFYYGDESEQYSFYSVPKMFFTNDSFTGLSAMSKLLYSFLLDRMSLSRKRNWIDDKNRAYIKYSLKSICSDMGVSRNSVIKYMRELQEFGLIMKFSKEGMEDIIYVMDFSKVKQMKYEENITDAQPEQKAGEDSYNNVNIDYSPPGFNNVCSAMTENDKLQMFEDRPIRTAWDETQEEWYFSIVDVVTVLTESGDYNTGRKYWNKLKQRLKAEGSELVTNCHQLKMKAADGKRRLTDVANTEQLLRIIQSVPSKKAEPFKMWLAMVGRERIEEIIDPELTIERALDTYAQKGYSPEWINQRLQTIRARKELTDAWKVHGVKEGQEYAILTDEVTKAWSGMNTRQYKNFKGLKKENLRDNMSTLELALNMLAEATTTELTNAQNPQGLEENRVVAKQGGAVAGNARKEIESKTGRPVVTAENASTMLLGQTVAGMIESVATEKDDEKSE